jgi:hypothetical protein
MDLSAWRGVPRPERVVMEGRYARLEPLDPSRHGADLLASAQAPGADDRFRYLFEDAPSDAASFTPWLEKATAGIDPLFFAVIDKATGRAEGRQALMRIDPVHGVIEIGSILWGPAIVASSGSATISTSLPSGQPCASASRSKACSAITWWPRAATATPLGSP